MLEMETHSEPATTTETVTDLEVGLPCGTVVALTLREEDVMREDETEVEVETSNPPDGWKFFKRNVAYIHVSVRSIVHLVPTPEAIKPVTPV